MCFKTKLFMMLSVMTLILSGCGDLNKNKVKKRELGSSQFKLECKLNVDNFTKIMSDPIEGDIRCLGESLNLFIKVVKTDRPGYLSRQQLESYIAKFEPDIKPEVVKAIKGVFQLGHLITGEEQDYISKATVDKIIEFALVLNEEASLHFPVTFNSRTPIDYTVHQGHQKRVQQASIAIRGALKNIYNRDRRGRIDQIRISELLDSFTTDSTRDEIEKVKKFLFAKKVLFGGEDDVITHNELEKLFSNFDVLMRIGLDGVKYSYIQFSENQNSLLQFFNIDVEKLYEIIDLGNRDNEVLFTMDQLIDAAKEVIDPEDFDLDKYRNLINEAKLLLTQDNVRANGDVTIVKGKELNKLFSHVKSILRTGTIFHRIWNKFMIQLESPQPVSIDFDEYRYMYPDDLAEVDQFERIVKKYRFMRGIFMSGYYTRGYKRNPEAIFEIALLEYALKLVFNKYGTETAGTVGGYTMSKDQVKELLKKFQDDLIELGLFTPRKTESTANTIALLSILFQYQSNDNKVMDVNEGAEFGVHLLTGMKVGEDMAKFYKNEANCSIDQFDRVDPACYRTHFWKGLCKNYYQYYPLMFESLGMSKKCDELVETPTTKDFLNRAIEAARSCNNYTDGSKEEIPYSEGDTMTIMMAMSHAESTVLRWDVNGNNILDANEVDNAYSIYSGALDGFLDDKNPIIKKFKKQIYQYMIKYEQAPDEKDFGSIWKFVKFLLKFDKKSPATRRTILSVLLVIAEQSAKSSTAPKFDCNWLRDPDNIPRESHTIMPEVDTRPDLSSFLEPYLHLAK